ncbi:hypothetical protein HerbRD11066_07880 [Herbidospora sp. RD11066]
MTTSVTVTAWVMYIWLAACAGALTSPSIVTPAHADAISFLALVIRPHLLGKVFSLSRRDIPFHGVPVVRR